MSGRSRKRTDSRSVWLGRYSPWVVLGLCFIIAVARPVYAQLKPEAKQSWAMVYRIANPPLERPTQVPELLSNQAAPGRKVVQAALVERLPTSDETFGRQLDTLTEFYDKLINFLFVLLATITALAFFTIRANTRAEQERAAFEALESERVKGLIQSKVADEIALQIGDIKSTLEELQALYEVLDDAVIARNRKGKNSGDSQAENPDT